jgi:hypothetical protein
MLSDASAKYYDDAKLVKTYLLQLKITQCLITLIIFKELHIFKTQKDRKMKQHVVNIFFFKLQQLHQNQISFKAKRHFFVPSVQSRP